MPNKRQVERERLRKLREETEKRESAEQRRRLFIGYGIAAVLGIAVIAGIVVLIGSSGGGGQGAPGAHINIATGQTNGVPTDSRTGPDPPPVADGNLQSAAKKANCVLMLNLKDEGHTHVEEGTKVKYKTNPPSSGNHVFPPAMQADGAYSATPEALDYVHSLEHGRMEIEYSSKLAESDQLEIKGLYDTLYGGTLLFPNDTMPYQVAAVTWTNIIGCKTYEGAKTLDAIRDFGRKTWNRYGAQAELDSFPIDGPTPAD
jgi:hypothetical protein